MRTREELNLASLNLQDNKKDLKSRIAAYNAKASKADHARQSITYDESAPKHSASQDDVLRKAREDARRADEERKRLEKRH